MLFVIVFSYLLLISPLSASDTAESHRAWAQELNKKALMVAEQKKDEAKEFVRKAEKASKDVKCCQVTGNPFQQSRKVLGLGENSPEKYPDLLVFVSFSMPLQTLKDLSSQVANHGGKLVFRGLFEGSFRKMAEKMKEIEAEVLIDPTLFAEHNVLQVPTFIKGKDRLAGNVSIEYALERFEGQLQ